MTDTSGSFLDLEELEERRRRMWRKRIAMTLTVVVVVAIGVPIGIWFVNRCGAGVTKHDGECVGVTDGSFVFDPALQQIEDKIKAENDSIAGQDYVTVAYLGSLTETPTVSIERIRSQLEGAYVAQHAANSSGIYPKVRLVLANKGSLEQAWESVTKQLTEMTEAPDRLVAVVGLGVSSLQTAESAKMLSRADIPMVGSVITADSLNTRAEGLGGPIDGLTKVVPNVGQLVAVLAEYLAQSRPDLRTAMLVSDGNPDDLYTSTLKKDFTEKQLAAYWVNGGSVIQPYDGTPGTSGILNQFSTIVSNFCGVDPPDMVFYAGRAALLPDFITQLRKRSCVTRPITVVSGFDAAGLRTTLPPPPDSNHPVSIIYAGPDPKALADPQWNRDFDQYNRFEKMFTTDSGFDPEDLEDGWAIMTHDAMLAAVTAITRATGQSPTPPTRKDVRIQLYLSNSPTTSVPGAAGTFMFNSTTGDVAGRRLPVMEIQPDNSFIVRGVFDQPVSP